MNRKTLLIIGLTLISLFLVQLNATVVSATSTSSKVEIVEATQVDSQPIVTINRETNFILHFESEESLNNYLLVNSAIRVFPNLKIVIVEGWSNDRFDLELIPGVNRVFDSANTNFERIEPVEYNKELTADDIKATLESAAALNTQPLYDLGYAGDDTIVYVIDTGINTAHVDFAGRISNSSFSFIRTYNGYGNNDTSINDINGHGTHVSGIAAGSGAGNAQYRGMAYEATILMGRVGDPIYDACLLDSFEYALTLGEKPDVVNLSIGGTDREGLDLLEILLNELALNNIVVASSSGNNGDYNTVGTPSTAAQVLSVASTTVTGGISSFSSKGPSADGHMKPDIAAPGSNIIAPGTGHSADYVTMSGTSMASPHIAGIAAILIGALKELNIPYDTGLINTAFMATADPGRYDYLTVGAGIANLGLAFEAIQNAPTNASDFPVLMWAAPSVPINEMSTVPQGYYGEFFVKSVSSTPWEDKTPTLNGSIATIATLDTTAATGPWAKNYKLTIDVAKDTPVGTYDGYVTFETAEGVKAYTYVKFDVIEGKARILSAKMKTSWSNNFYMGQYYDFMSELMKSGIAICEFRSGTLTYDFLKEFDAVWFHDPFNYNYPNLHENNITRVTDPTLSNDEKLAIHQYIDDGGNMLLIFLGASIETTSFGNLLTGNNIGVINGLLEPYNITASSTHYSFSDPELATVVGYHATTEGVNYIDHYGTFLTITDEDKNTLLATHNSNGVAVAHETETGGRVMVCTTNFHFDNTGFANGYHKGKTQNDVFGMNVMNWLVAKNKLQGSYVESTEYTDFTITASPTSSVVTAKIEKTNNLGETTVEAVSLTSGGDGVYTYRLNYEEEDMFYKFIAETVDDKYVGVVINDNSGPAVTPKDWTNNTRVDELKEIEFMITDVSKISSVIAKVDGTNAAAQITGNTAKVVVIINRLADNTVHNLTITATDENGFSSTYKFVMWKGIDPVTEETPFAFITVAFSLVGVASILLRKRK